jgi:hypothetical protein
MKAPSKDDSDSEEDDPMSGVSRGYEALGEREEDEFDQEEEEAFLLASILLRMKGTLTNEGIGGISNQAASKNDGDNIKRTREHRGPFFIPQYHKDSKSDDAEGVDEDNYGMSVLEIDESLFGKQKYHKGILISYTYFFSHPLIDIQHNVLFFFCDCIGHFVLGCWVVGVRDKDGRIRLEVVADRGTVRLTRFVETYVRPGSWLHSDYWKGYANGTSNTQDIFGAMGIRGMSVNHDKTFKQWVAEHRKWAMTNGIEGDWNAIICKTPKRKYGYKSITPYLRQVEWDRESKHRWLDWWKAFSTCTVEKAKEFTDHLNELHASDPNAPKPTHRLLSMYPRGFHTIKGNNVGKQSSKNRFHYAYCSTSNPNYYGCLKCDFYWGQFCIGEVDLIKEARKAAYMDEKEKAKKNKTNRLALVITALETAYEAAEKERREAVEAKMLARKAGKEDMEAGDDEEGDDGDELNPFDEEEEEEEEEGKVVGKEDEVEEFSSTDDKFVGDEVEEFL